MKKVTLLMIVLLAALLAGCAATAPQSTESNLSRGSYVTGVLLNETRSGEKSTGFTVPVSSDNMPVGVLLVGSTSQGELSILIKDAAGKTVWQSEPAGGSIVKIETTITTLPKADYELFVGWNDATVAQYNLYMVPGEAVKLAKVPPLALMGGLGMILVALAYIIYAAVRKLGWGYLGLGALAWIITVAVKFLIAIPLNQPIYNLVTGSLPGVAGETIFNLYVGALTGITEVLLVWLWVRYTRMGKVSWSKAFAFGIGFGAVEALLLGLSSAATTLTALISPALLNDALLNSLAQNANILYALAPISERFFVVLLHIFCNVLLFYSAAVRKPGYFWLSFVFKSLIDAVAAYAQLNGLSDLGAIWSVEAIVAAWGILSLVGTFWVAGKYKALDAAQKEPITPAVE